MKKILFLLSMFALFSCEQENLDNLVDDSNTKAEQQSIINSRVASTIADFDPIAELAGIQVNILNMGTSPYKYLSCVKKGNKVDLYDKDDGSMRQRWYIGDNTIKLVGGNQTFENKDAYVTVSDNTEEPDVILIDPKSIPGFIISGIPRAGFFDYINDDLIIELYASLGSPQLGGSTEMRYLQPKTKNSNDLQYKKGNNDMSTHWRLELVGDDYEFEKIQYIKATGDYLNLQAPILRQYEYYNMGKSEPGEATFQINETVEYTSTFSESQTVSISHKISATSNIGTPTVVSGNISSETTL